MPETKQLFSAPRCQHVHYSGRACKAPARRGRNFCVFHQAAHFDAGGCVLPIIEDLHSYQLAIIRIARALADDLIDSRKATALLYALQLAGSKLNDFVKQRGDVEDPARALYAEVSERYQARKHPFPSFISDKDLSAILKDIALEDISQRRQAEMPEVSIENSPVPPDYSLPPSNPVGTTATPSADSVAPASDSCPPRNDIGTGINTEAGAA